MLRPRSNAQQWISKEEYKLNPNVPVFEYTDNYSNLCQRLVAPSGIFSVRTSAEVKTIEQIERKSGAPFVEIQNLPDNVLSYLLPSRYCESDRFNDLACQITNGFWPGYDQVEAIENWLQTNIQYLPGSSAYPLSAVEVNQRQYGVCRDLAHLGIALCRSISIPARMVVGYLYDLKPMDLHAWFEAYVGDKWYLFDAVRTSTIGGYVAVGYGRDAADVAIYNQFGPSVFPIEQIIQVEKIENES